MDSYTMAHFVEDENYQNSSWINLAFLNHAKYIEHTHFSHVSNRKNWVKHLALYAVAFTLLSLAIILLFLRQKESDILPADAKIPSPNFIRFNLEKSHKGDRLSSFEMLTGGRSLIFHRHVDPDN